MARKTNNLVAHRPTHSRLQVPANWGDTTEYPNETEVQWTEYGRTLGHVERMVGWEIGGWWNRGSRFDRLTIVNDPEWTGPSYQTCKIAGLTAAKFPPVRRRTSITYSHHVELVSVPAREAKRLLDRLEQEAQERGEIPSVSQLRQWLKSERRNEKEAAWGRKIAASGRHDRSDDDAPEPPEIEGEAIAAPAPARALPVASPIRMVAQPSGAMTHAAAVQLVSAGLLLKGFEVHRAAPDATYDLIIDRHRTVARLRVMDRDTDGRLFAAGQPWELDSGGASHNRPLDADEADLLAAVCFPDSLISYHMVDRCPAVLDMPDARQDLDAALDQLVNARRAVDLDQIYPKFPNKTYGVLLADPPWSFETWSEAGKDRSADNHYPTLRPEVLFPLGAYLPAAPDCVLFLWATPPTLEQAIYLMRAWGFTYKSQYCWGKPKPGTGYWTRAMHELLLIGTRGKVPAPAPGTQANSLQQAASGRHSEKPATFHAIIEKQFPSVPKLEMFARSQRPGWDAWGNEVLTAAAE